MNKKLFYTQPTTDLLELRVEGLVCTSIILQVYGGNGAAGGDAGFGEDDNNYGDF